MDLENSSSPIQSYHSYLPRESELIYEELRKSNVTYTA